MLGSLARVHRARLECECLDGRRGNQRLDEKLEFVVVNPNSYQTVVHPQIRRRLRRVKAEYHQSIYLGSCFGAVTMQSLHFVALNEGEGLSVVFLLRVAHASYLSGLAVVCDQRLLLLQRLRVVYLELVSTVDQCEVVARVDLARSVVLVIQDWQSCLVIKRAFDLFLSLHSEGEGKHKQPGSQHAAIRNSLHLKNLKSLISCS